MLNHALVFLVIALLVGALGFGVVAGAAAFAAVLAARPPADPAPPLSFPFFPSLP